MTITATDALRNPSPSASKGLKRDRTIYWTTTALVCAVMVFSIVNFTFLDRVPFPEGGFVHLGLPKYFRTELTIAKALGVLALLIPGVPAKIKEFAYFGFAITLVSASFAHFSSGDARISVLFIVDPLIFLGLLRVSYFYFERSLRWPDGPSSQGTPPRSSARGT